MRDAKFCCVPNVGGPYCFPYRALDTLYIFSVELSYLYCILYHWWIDTSSPSYVPRWFDGTTESLFSKFDIRVSNDSYDEYLGWAESIQTHCEKNQKALDTESFERYFCGKFAIVSTNSTGCFDLPGLYQLFYPLSIKFVVDVQPRRDTWLVLLQAECSYRDFAPHV